MSSVRELQHWGTADLQRLRTGLQAHTDAWCERWGVATALSVHCGQFGAAARSDAHSVDLPEQWNCLGQVGSEVLVMLTTKATRQGLASMVEMFTSLLFPIVGWPSDAATAPAGPLAHDIGRQAMLDWVKWFLDVEDPGALLPESMSPQPLRDEWLLPWSGAVWVRLDMPETACWIAISSNTMERLIAANRKSLPKASPDARLTLLEKALAPQTIQLEAQLQPIPLSVADLVSLQVGDVLRTAHPLDQPLLLVDSKCSLVSHGFLGRLSQRRALSLAPMVTNSHRHEL